MSSQFGCKEKLDDGLKFQVTTGKLFKEPVKDGQTVKVVKKFVGGKQFDIHSCPPDDESLMISRFYVDKVYVEKVRKGDHENMTPQFDLQFPNNADDVPYTDANGNVQNFEVATDAYCEEVEETNADDETDGKTEAHVDERKDLHSCNAVLKKSSNVTDEELAMEMMKKLAVERIKVLFQYAAKTFFNVPVTRSSYAL